MEDSNNFPQCRGEEGEEQRGGPTEKNIDNGEDLGGNEDDRGSPTEKNIDDGDLGGDMTNSLPFPLMAANVPLLDRSIWPLGFKDLAEYLERYNLGHTWMLDGLGRMGRIQQQQGQGSKIWTALTGCLPAVTEWIKSYHRINLTILAEDIHKYANSW